MPLFFIIDDNENDVRKCHESRLKQRSISISGTDISGEETIFAGIVQSIVRDHTAQAGSTLRCDDSLGMRADRNHKAES
jgi:hypothetical protein